MVRKAVIVGIDYYEADNVSSLSGCVKDATSVDKLLSRHADGTRNFAGGTSLILGTKDSDVVKMRDLRSEIKALFDGDGEVALLYFAGHGTVEATGGYLCAGDCETSYDGIPLSSIMTWANNSKFNNRIVILDSCHGGVTGEPPNMEGYAELKEGMTILTGATKEQYASEINGSGVFTSLLTDALAGGASDLLGQVTPSAAYAHIDQSLGPRSQRPVFKTNVKRFVSLRNADPKIGHDELMQLLEFFPTPGHEFPLDPTFEPERSEAELETLPKPIEANTKVFATLQKYNRLNLLVPVDAPHMWHAAMQSKKVRLTMLGEHYRRLVERDLI